MAAPVFQMDLAWLGDNPFEMGNYFVNFMRSFPQDSVGFGERKSEWRGVEGSFGPPPIERIYD